MKKFLTILTVIAYMLLSSAIYAQVTRLNNQSTPATEFLGWDNTGTSKSLDIKNAFTSQPITFWTSGTQQMTIDQNGNVGIGTGTATLYSLFQVKNLINFDNTNSNTFLGNNAGHSNFNGVNNIAIGVSALYNNDSPSNNIAIGNDALYTQFFYDDSWSTDNVAIGYMSLYSNTPITHYLPPYEGIRNVGIGNSSLQNNTLGSSNTAVGHLALNSNTEGSFNTAIGYGADVSSGTYNNASAIGSGAIATGSNMVVLGNTYVTSTEFSGALMPYYSISGTYNYQPGSTGQVLTSQGDYAPQWTTPWTIIYDNFNPTGTLGIVTSIGTITSTNAAWLTTGNTGTSPGTDFIGTIDNENLIFKVNNLLAGELDDVHFNTFFGYETGNLTMTGSLNIGIGYNSFTANTTGRQNVAIGSGVLASNTIGVYNIGFGGNALNANTSGNDNAAFNANALLKNTSGSYNFAFGMDALENNVSGNFNIGIGYAALANNTNSYNIGIGSYALLNSTGGNNTAIGYDAGYDNTSGTGNLFEGMNAGYYNTTGTNNTCLGYSSNVGSGALSNATAIGNGAIVSSSNTILLGNSSVTQLEFNGALMPYYSSAYNSGTTGQVLTSQGANVSPQWTSVVGPTGPNLQGIQGITGPTGATGPAGTAGCSQQNIVIKSDGNGNGECSQIYDDGTNVGINNTEPVAKLDVLEDASEPVPNPTIGANVLNADILSEDNGVLSGIESTVDGNETEVDVSTHIAGWFIASNASNNYGIDAWASGTGTNIGVYGSAWGGTTNWAAEWNGNTLTNGSPYYSSDKQFKIKIDSIPNAIGIINRLKPCTYYFDTTNIYGMNFDGKKQYGLIAQDVEKVLPELVKTTTNPSTFDSKGKEISKSFTFKSLNYNAFIAILLEDAKEKQNIIDSLKTIMNSQQALIDTLNSKNLNERLTEVESIVNQCCNINHEKKNTNIHETELNNGEAIVLDQNVPNPFAESTTISYFIPDNISSAQIIFTDNTGRILKTVDIKEKGKGMLKVYAQDLSSGIYSYTLVAEGKTIDSKKMIKMNK